MKGDRSVEAAEMAISGVFESPLGLSLRGMRGKNGKWKPLRSKRGVFGVWRGGPRPAEQEP